jgi:hypothetical protein
MHQNNRKFQKLSQRQKHPYIDIEICRFSSPTPCRNRDKSGQETGQVCGLLDKFSLYWTTGEVCREHLNS